MIRRWLIVGCAGTLLLVVGVPLMLVVGIASTASAGSSGCTGGQTVDVTPGAAGLDPEQTGNASIIISAGLALHVPTFGLQVGIAVARQESTLHNLPGGDRDSVGLYQQRAGWGTYAQRHDPSWAASKFFSALLTVPGWQKMPLTVAAQAVQHSGTPTAYARWATLAQRVVAGVSGVLPATCTGTPLTTVGAGSAATEAAAILKLWGTGIDGNPGAKSDLVATASGAGFTSCGHHIMLDADLLRLYLLALQRFRITVMNFSTGHACDQYFHPWGAASDIGAVTELATGLSTNFTPGTPGNQPALVVKFVDFLADHGPNHLALGQSQCADHAGADAAFQRIGFNDSCTHAHVNVHQDNQPSKQPYTAEKWPA